jgi:hypothetical protein
MVIFHKISRPFRGKMFCATKKIHHWSGLMSNLSHVWDHIQTTLFPFLDEQLDPLTEKQKTLSAILELVRLEDFIPGRWWFLGRPTLDRVALAKAFVAKMVYDCTTTAALIDQLQTTPNLRRLCGWERAGAVPSESTFSRAFAEFAASGLPNRAHQALIAAYQSDRLVGHLSRDATDIAAREKPAAKLPKPSPPKAKRGRPRQGEPRPAPEPSRLERQAAMGLDEMLADLPQVCDVGTKKKNGQLWRWIGYKLHVDWADGEIPVSAVLTSASVHDSQAALPLAELSARRVTSLYDLMDSAYDSQAIVARSLALGHVPIIDPNPRGGEKLEMAPADKRRYDERSTAERGFSMLKESFGGRHVRVRGCRKVEAHLMFGLLALTAERLLTLLL